MALKRLVLPLPAHLKKFLEYQFETRKDSIHIEKSSWLGSMIHLSSMYVPYTQKHLEHKGEKVTLQYYMREKVYDVPNEKVQTIVNQIDETFRMSLIHYVLGLRKNLQTDYSPFIADYLKLIGYEPDEEKEWEKIRKIYRDYEEKTSKKNQKRFA